MRRDFTYIDDVVEAVVRLIDRPRAADPALVGRRARSRHEHRALAHLQHRQQQAGRAAATSSRLLEKAIGKKAMRELLPMQPGDVPATYADVDDLMRDVGFRPATPIAEGVGRFIEWYRDYHRV